MPLGLAPVDCVAIGVLACVGRLLGVKEGVGVVEGGSQNCTFATTPLYTTELSDHQFMVSELPVVV